MITRMAGDLDAARGYLGEGLQMFGQASDALSISMILTGFAFMANNEGLHDRPARLVGASGRIRAWVYLRSS